MSKSVKGNAWFIRVDGNLEFLTQKCNELASNVDTVDMLAVFHKGEKGDNPHAHIVIVTFSIVQKQSFALRIKSLFSIDKRTQYAIDVWDGDKEKGASSYLWHESDAKLIVKKNFTEENIARQKELCVEVQKVVARNKEKASARLVERALTEDLDSRYDILLWMLKQIKEGQAYHPGEYKLKQFVEEVMIRKTGNISNYAMELERRLWRD